jgi:tetratricopeptide (TPR) repeat protein
MNEVALKQPRRILPRWRLFATTARLGELNPKEAKNIQPIKFDDGSALIQRWKEERLPGIAAEVLAHAVFSKDRALALEAAMFLERHRDRNMSRTPLDMLVLATTRKDGLPLEDPWLIQIYQAEERSIRELRQGLRMFPHNAIAWAELALLHARNGAKEKASRCMKVAVSLAPDDRFVIRSAVRCFSHLRDPEIGLHIINRTARTKEDPWLLSAQIALTQSLDKPQRLMRNANHMIESGRYSSWDLSELNAAVGSLLHHDNVHKKANKHFRASLLQPTENALCQVIFDQKSPAFHDLTQSIHPPRNFESETRTFYSDLEIEKACDSAKSWLSDEPFSARPALFGSFVASVALEDYEQSLMFLEDGLTPNPNSSLLLNNKALSLARLGRTDEAEESLRKARENARGEEQTDTILTATDGLIHFRKGEAIQGREKYEAAIAQARKGGRISQEAMALVFLAREEFDARTEVADQAIKRAEESVKRVVNNNLDTRIAMARLLMAVEKRKEDSGDTSAASSTGETS